MKKKIINLILKVKNKLPEKYHFYLIGCVSYVYLYFYVAFSKSNLKKDLFIHKKLINKINLSGRKVFVFMPSTDWSDLKQRPQHLAKAFAMSGHNVIFLTKNQTSDNINGIEEIFDNFYVCSNLLLINSIHNVNLIFIGPSNFPLLKFLKKYDNLIYDFPDELDFFPGLTKKTIEKYHKKLIKASNLVTPSASFLEQIILKHNSFAKTQIILNGVFPNDFILNTSDNIIPEDMNKFLTMGKKIVGFYGGLGEKWLDFELLRYLTENKEDYLFIIIGGGNIEFIKQKYKFNNLTNIFFIGPRKYEELKHYAKFFDVALIPFLLNELTLGVSPIKSFEYMIQGIPFVSTALPECSKYKHVLIGENYEDFLRRIDEGIELKSDKNYIQGLKQEGLQNTWESRVKTIIDNLD